MADLRLLLCTCVVRCTANPGRCRFVLDTDAVTEKKSFHQKLRGGEDTSERM